MILVVSPDKDFSSALAEQVERELGFACVQVETFEEAKNFMAKAAVVVSDVALSKCPAAVINVAEKKPLRMGALLADIETTLQKSAAGETWPIGKDYLFSLLRKQLSHACGNVTELTDKEAQLLRHMLKAGKKGISKEALLKQVWGFEENLNTHTLETHIYRLRAKFKDLSGAETIEAVEGGYRLAI